MTTSLFLKKINWRQILIHSIAILLLMKAFEALSYLHDTEFLADLVKAKQAGITPVPDEIFTVNRLHDLILSRAIGSLTGLIAGVVISLLVAWRYKWLWLNSILAAIPVFVLPRVGLKLPDSLSPIFYFPPFLLKDITTSLILDSLVFFIPALLLFFLKKVNRFIDPSITVAEKDKTIAHIIS